VSRENVEVVRELLEAFQRRGHERPFDFYDPEMRWRGFSTRKRRSRLPGFPDSGAS